ncbi:DNA-3-methyladenine glycosylase [Sphingomonas endophytica]|uniref:Putative 3-methyladenine DNA glycosylase n=1 Tax=Sphingomonas endophytica TaxID=869719 RepID=A0A147I7J5_9SPHN|nr:DNA-3-methyladenine glycosylase [Sphingomonas endophytica]KTT74984.1 3-methyladenine DNA glycosylase [Sphingomonas endophytica]
MDRSFFSRDVVTVARALIGVTVTVDGVGGVIVETEAYDAADPASHSFAGPKARNATMFGPAGAAYVYRIYGLHHCLNVTCGDGAAVLIRALAPTDGVATMQERRGISVRSASLCAGPGRLCSALDIDLAFDGKPLDALPFAWRDRAVAPPILATPRIGITRAAATPWRFILPGSPSLSRPAPAADRR